MCYDIYALEKHNEPVRKENTYPGVDSIEKVTEAWHKTVKSTEIRVTQVNKKGA